MSVGMAVLIALGALASAPWLVSGGRRTVGRVGNPGGTPRSPQRRRRRPGAAARAGHGEAVVDDAVVLDMVRAALRAGCDVVTAIESVGTALPEVQGQVCRRAARALRLGSSWDAAWQEATEVARALAPAWADGVDPEPLLVHAAAAVRSGRSARAREAAARLGVRLVLPLGLCLLPAFVLLGLVPLLLSAGVQLWGG